MSFQEGWQTGHIRLEAPYLTATSASQRARRLMSSLVQFGSSTRSLVCRISEALYPGSAAVPSLPIFPIAWSPIPRC